MNRRRAPLLPLVLALASPLLGGCAVAHLAGAMLQNEEYQKKIEVLPKYNDLEGRSVAVIVDADMTTLYDHPTLVEQVCGGVSARIARDVPGLRTPEGRSLVVDPRIVIRWQYQTPQWNAMPYGEIAEQLNVDRVILVDIYEYRLHPPGNSWMWEGVCAANVGVIERDGIDPDMFAQTLTVEGRFPTVDEVTREEARREQIEYGVLSEFVKRTAWLFHTHLEPKYPDKYRPELEG